MKKPISGQLELFNRDPMEHLFPYWRNQLKKWPARAWKYRHDLNCTGWSLQRLNGLFARHLFIHGQLSKSEYRKWWRFSRRIKRWETIKTNTAEETKE